MLRTASENDFMIDPQKLLLMVCEYRARAGLLRAAVSVPRDSYRGRGGARGAANAMIGLAVQAGRPAANAGSEG
jgi:hypothetical protein